MSKQFRGCGHLIATLVFLALSSCSHSPPRPPLIVDVSNPSRTLETLNTRPGVQQSFLHIQPLKQDAKTLVIFPGGGGAGQVFEKDGALRTKGSFTARTIDLWKGRYRLVVVDAPSDQPKPWGMSEGFRSSDRHRQDILAILSSVAERWQTDFYLIGTSLSTICC